MVERCLGKTEVGSSILLVSTNIPLLQNQYTDIPISVWYILYMKKILNFLHHFKNFFEPDIDDAIENFCKTEYGKNWYSAYLTYKEEGRFPNHIRRTL